MTINPYSGVNWGTVGRIVSTSHAHGRSETALMNGVNGGLEHFALSNYYPSEPYYPLDDFFPEVPSGLIGSPNAEHHGFNVARCHLNGLGCTLTSGNPKGVSPVGMATVGATTWKLAIKAILNTIMFPDAGGVTINHPTWTGLDPSLVKLMLDFDSRVLGIEICNSVGYYEEYKDREDLSSPYAYEMWDNVLLTGRRCWGFCVPDHGLERSEHWTGRNILLTNDATNYGCLKAYRDGAFYSKIYDSDLAFVSVTLSDHTITATTANADSITVIIDGIKTEYAGNTVEVVVPSDAVYARIEASKAFAWTNEEGNSQNVVDKVFSNPFIFKEYVPKKRSFDRIGVIDL